MKTICSLCFLFLALPSFLLAQHDSIHFVPGKMSDILAVAAREHKPIFMDAYTTWCGPCKWMEKTAYRNDTVADFYNKNFVCIKVDMEKGEGPELAKRYKVRNYPTYLFVDASGEIMHRTCGSRPVKDFVEAGQKAMNPNENYHFYQSSFDMGMRDASFMRGYIDAKGGACMKTDSLLTEYFKTQAEKDLMSRDNWTMIYKYLDNVDAKEFNYFEKNYDQYTKLYTADSVDMKISNAYMTKFYTLIYDSVMSRSKYDALKNKVSAMHTPGSGKILFQADLALASKTKDWKQYGQLAYDNIDKYYNDDAGALNNFAWDFFTNINDSKMLEKALEWSRRSLVLDESAGTKDTEANLLNKLGRKQEAIAAEEKAIDLAQKEKGAVDSFKETLEQFKKGK